MPRLAIAIHGGAGTIVREDMHAELEKAYKEGLEAALQQGYSLLEKGRSATDAVTAACMILEDNILFNAGKGSVFTKNGSHEMDAAIMEGATLNAGAVAGVRSVRNPIKLAAEIMHHSNHIFLSGEGAIEFALLRGIPLEGEDYFYSGFRYDQWKEIRDSDVYALDHSDQRMEELMKEKKFGTVGAVARDADGNIAAATSTGGMTNKRYGRIGDTPIIGAGNYANNATCAISCTGHGEKFIQAVAAYDVSCLMEYKKLSLAQAMYIVVHEKLRALNGEGGMIGMDAVGNAAMDFNTPGMYRAVKNSDGLHVLSIYQEKHVS